MRLAADALLLASLANTHAQELRGSLAGQITDPSNRSIEKASIAATTVAPGFKESIHEGIAVRSAERTAVKIALELGLVSERVIVTGDATALSTDAASRGSTVTRAQIVDLPNNGRNIFQLVWAAPG